MVLTLLAVVLSASDCAPGIALAGAKPTECRVRRYDERAFPTAGGATEPIEGRVDLGRFRHEKGTEDELADAYRVALEKAGFRVVYDGPYEEVTVVSAVRGTPVSEWISIELFSDGTGKAVEAAVERVRSAKGPGRPLARNASSTKDVKGCVDPLGLGRLPGSVLDECSTPGKSTFEVPMSAERRDTVEGKLTRLRYTMDPDTTSLEVAKSYQLALLERGWRIVFTGEEGVERLVTATREVDGRQDWLVVAAANVNNDRLAQVYLTLIAGTAMSL